VKKPHERPSIGVLLCATKDSEVVEYALNRTLSPALVAEYQTVLPPRALLQRKLHELYAQLAPEEPIAAPTEVPVRHKVREGSGEKKPAARKPATKRKARRP
jgi:hypothetical protein